MFCNLFSNQIGHLMQTFNYLLQPTVNGLQFFEMFPTLFGNKYNFF